VNIHEFKVWPAHGQGAGYVGHEQTPVDDVIPAKAVTMPAIMRTSPSNIRGFMPRGGFLREDAGLMAQRLAFDVFSSILENRLCGLGRGGRPQVGGPSQEWFRSQTRAEMHSYRMDLKTDRNTARATNPRRAKNPVIMTMAPTGSRVE